MVELFPTNIKKMIVSNVGGVIAGAGTRLEKLQWYMLVAIIFLGILSITGIYKEMLHTGIIMKYGDYKRWIMNYIKTILFYCVFVATINYILNCHEVGFIDGMLSIILIALNFTIKGVLIFIISNNKSFNIVVTICFLLEVLCVETEVLKKTLIEWSMLNRSTFMIKEGFGVVDVIFVQLAIITIIFKFIEMKIVRTCLICYNK